MSRNPRNFKKNNIYHIIQKSAKGIYAFQESIDKANFLRIVQEEKLRHPFELLYYVIMDNHVHMIAKMTDVKLSLPIGQINRLYSRYYNENHDKKGNVFPNRYNSIEICGRNHLLTVVEYIAHNPVKASIVERAVEYRWSAHNEIASKQRGCIDKYVFLLAIDSDEKKAYRIYMNRIDPEI